MKWHVYILKCRDNSLYTGITTDLKRRVMEHNDAEKGAKYTRVRRPVELVYSEAASDRSAALIREAALKKLRREQKLKLLIQKPRQKAVL